jgi:hypothetical protein
MVGYDEKKNSCLYQKSNPICREKILEAATYYYMAHYLRPTHTNVKY